MLTIIDNLNKRNTLTSDCRLVSFDIINMFPNIGNIFGLKAFKSILDARQDQFTPMSCSYSDIATQYFDVKVLEYTPLTICWKRFMDDIFIVWPHGIDELFT